MSSERYTMKPAEQRSFGGAVETSWPHRSIRSLAVGLLALAFFVAWQRVRPVAEDSDGCPLPVEVGGVVVCSREELQERLGALGCPGMVDHIRPGAVVRCRGGRAVLARMPAWKQRLLEVPVDLNQAEQEDLESLPGIGPELARRILAHRRRHGCLHSFGDLLAVPGVGIRVIGRLARRARVGPCGQAGSLLRRGS